MRAPISKFAASAALAIVVFAAPPVEAQTRADNRAACRSTDPDTAIGGCSRDIASGEEKTPADLAVAYYDRAMAYDDEDLVDKAVSDYTKAIELNPNDSNYYDNRGADYFSSGRVNDAIADFRAALKVNPNDPIASKNLAAATAP
jgi:tetratricopeptide (TPR) repeat protein